MRTQTDGSPWSMRRATRGGGTEVPVARPERDTPLDLAAWAEYEAKNAKANREYDRLMAEPAQSPNSRPPCGTEAGYMSHYRRKETACRPCKSAHSVYCERKRKEKK